MKKYLAIAAVMAAFSFSAPAHAQGTFQCVATNGVGASFKGEFKANARQARQSANQACLRATRKGLCKVTSCVG
jgi:Na+-driven multidrug efflux pump